MAADGEQVRSKLRRSKGDLQKSLHGIGVEQSGAAGAADGLGGLPHGLQGAQLVVDQHQGYQRRVGPQSGLQIFAADAPALVRFEVRDLAALGSQGADRLQHGGVLDGGYHDMPAPAFVELHGGTNGPVVPLRAAGGEIQLLRRAAQPLGHNGPVFRQPRGRRAARSMTGGGVPKPLGHHFQRGPGGLGADTGGRGVVQIGGHKQSPLSRVRTIQRSLIVSPGRRKVKLGRRLPGAAACVKIMSAESTAKRFVRAAAAASFHPKGYK